MTPVSHSALNAAQLAQVAYLFADDLFGTDAAAFVYELDVRGDVVRREMSGQAVKQVRATTRPQTEVTLVRETHVTEDRIRSAQMHMQALSAMVAEKLYQQTFEEVNHVS